MQNQLIKRFQHSPADPWQWDRAVAWDAADIVAMAEEQFQQEVDQIFQISPDAYRYAIDLATVNQRHNLAHEQLTVARVKSTGKLAAYAWITRGSRPPYSLEETAEGRMLHLDLALPEITRIRLTVQALTHWELWARACAIPVLVSSTIRSDSHTFLRLHEQLGYSCRGNICYKRIGEPHAE